MCRLGPRPSALRRLLPPLLSHPAPRRVVLLRRDFSLSGSGPYDCAPGVWPKEGVVVARDLAIVGDVGRPFATLDCALILGAFRIVTTVSMHMGQP